MNQGDLHTQTLKFILNEEHCHLKQMLEAQGCNKAYLYTILLGVVGTNFKCHTERYSVGWVYHTSSPEIDNLH